NDTQPNTRSLAGANTGIRIWNIVAGAGDNADSASFDLAFSTKPELRIAGVSMNDGGGDNYPDPNETVQLTVTLRNVGLASGAVSLTLASPDANATVTTAASTAPAIAG